MTASAVAPPASISARARARLAQCVVVRGQRQWHDVAALEPAQVPALLGDHLFRLHDRFLAHL